MPPLRGLSSYQGVRAGSFNSFGVGSSYSSGVEGLSGSHYSVPGLFSRLQTSGCGCSQGRGQCTNVNSHYESASIYSHRDKFCLPRIPTSEQNKIYFNSDGTCVKINCDMCESSLCICKEPDFPASTAYHLDDESDCAEEESVYADSEFGECSDQADQAQVGLPTYL